MSFTLHVDVERWRAHQRSVLDASPGLVPVIKGTGYGFGNARLATEAALLGVDVVAVGTVDEVEAVRTAFAGDVLVLTPSYDVARDAAARPASCRPSRTSSDCGRCMAGSGSCWSA